MTTKLRLISSIFIALVWLTTSSTYAQTPVESCPGFLPSRLIIGEIGRVLPDTPNRIRQQPDIDSELIGEIPVGHTVSILAGPTCDSSGMAWWQVDYQGVVGWTAEGQGQTYWLEPVSRITPATATQLTEKMRLGRGHLNTKVLWLKDGTIAVGGQFGIWLYDGEHLDAEPRLLGENMGEVTYLAATNDGTNRLISIDCTKRGGEYNYCIENTVRFWSVESDQLLSSVVFDGAFGFTLSVNGDATMVASAIDETTIQLWDLNTRKRGVTLPKQDDTISALSFSPDGKLLASGTMTGEVRLWDVDTGTALAVLSNQKYQITDIEFSPDGKTMATGISIEKVYFWDVMTGTLIWSVPNNADVEDPYCMYGCMSSDGTTTAADLTFNVRGDLLAAANWAGTLTLWEAQAGRQLRVIDTKSYENVTSIAFSPDGTQLVTNHVDPERNFDNSIKVWDIASERQVADLQSGHIRGVNDVEFSPDGATLASAGFDVQLWNVADGQHLGTISEIWANVSDVAFTADGTHIVGSGDAGCGECSITKVWFWDTTTTENVGEFSGSLFAPPAKTAISADGQYIASSLFDDATVSFLPIKVAATINGDDTLTHEAVSKSFGDQGFVTDIEFSPDGNLLAAVTANQLHLWSVADDSLPYTINTTEQLTWDIAFSPDSQRIAAANGRAGQGISSGSQAAEDNTIRIWDVTNHNLLATLEHGAPVDSVTFNHSGNLIAGGTLDGVLTLWDANTYTLLSQISTACGRINHIDFSPDDTLLALACSDSTIRVMGIG